MLFVAGSANAMFVQYRVIDMGSLSGLGATPLSVNEFGHATGVSAVGVNSANAFLYSGGTMADLGYPAPFSRSVGNSINDHGQVAGTAANHQGDVTRGVLFDGSTMIVLGTLGGAKSQARGLNNLGQVTGSAQLVDGTSHAYVYDAGTMHDIGALHGHTSIGYDINDGGQVVGVFLVGGNGQGGFFYDGTQMRDISSLGARSASAINESGAITGQTYGNVAYLLAGDTLTPLGTLGGSSSAGLDVNDAGMVVGESYLPGDAESRGFLYYDGTMWDLANLLDPTSSAGWFVQKAYSINDHGQIVGTGLFGGQVRAILLDPVDAVQVPIPGTATLAVTGVLMVMAMRSSGGRRRTRLS